MTRSPKRKVTGEEAKTKTIEPIGLVGRCFRTLRCGRICPSPRNRPGRARGWPLSHSVLRMVRGGAQHDGSSPHRGNEAWARGRLLAILRGRWAHEFLARASRPRAAEADGRSRTKWRRKMLTRVRCGIDGVINKLESMTLMTLELIRRKCRRASQLAIN